MGKYKPSNDPKELEQIKKEVKEYFTLNNFEFNENNDDFLDNLEKFAVDSSITLDDVYSIINNEYYNENDITNYYVNSNEESEENTYYQCRDINRFTKEFNKYQTKVRQSFKELFKATNERYPMVSSLLSERDIISKAGLAIPGGKAKRMMNDQTAENARSVVEFRVGATGEGRAKPTIYSVPDTVSNYIFLGVCSMKNDGDRAEDSKIQKTYADYVLYKDSKKDIESLYSLLLSEGVKDMDIDFKKFHSVNLSKIDALSLSEALKELEDLNEDEQLYQEYIDAQSKALDDYFDNKKIDEDYKNNSELYQKVYLKTFNKLSEFYERRRKLEAYKESKK